MVKSKKQYICIHLLVIMALGLFQSFTYKFGGFQLLMTIEQQSKINRIIKYIEIDHFALQDYINSILFFNGKKRENIILNEAKKSKVVALSTKLAKEFDNLNISFKSVYFAYDSDHRYKKYFDPLVAFKRNLNNTPEEIEMDYLFDLLEQSKQADQLINTVKIYVKEAEIKKEEEINEKIKEMSIWQWLFGY